MTLLSPKSIKYYQDKIESLGEWYQPIKFTKNLKTPAKHGYKSMIHGINKWNFIIRRNLPKDLSGKKILILGASSGLYSILCAREKAKVVAIEKDSIAYKQSLLTRKIFSRIDKIDYSSRIKIIKKDFMKIKWNEFPPFDHFDIALALNVLYWIHKQEYSQQGFDLFIENLKKHIKLFIIQGDENKYYHRKKTGGSIVATNARTVVNILEKHNFVNIQIDKPICLSCLLRSIIFNKILEKNIVSEVDIHKPIFYSRPIVKAETK